MRGESQHDRRSFGQAIHICSHRPRLAPWRLHEYDRGPLSTFIHTLTLIQSGFRGYPHKTKSNELSVLVTELPRLLSRCTNNIPEKITNEETKAQNRYVAFMTDRRGTDVLRFRSVILETMRRFFSERDFVDVQTPILADSAGGAIARPFQTKATEFEDRDLALRIAPELWLKKLIIGGLEKIYEIGPSFRNEGTLSVH